MSKSRRKQRKEYERRKRQATRRREERNRAVAEQARQNAISGALGIAAAVGYNKNVLSQAVGLSKITQTNYLTTTLHKLRMQKRLQNFLKKFKKEKHTSHLHYAIKKLEPVAVQMILAQPGVLLEEKDIHGRTPLIHTLNKLMNTLDHTSKWLDQHSYRRNKEIPAALKIIELLLSKGAKTDSAETLAHFWESGDEYIPFFLKRYPRYIIQQSRLKRDEIYSILNNMLEAVEEEIDFGMEYNNDMDWYYPTAPGYVIDRRDRLEASLDYFRNFMDDNNDTNYENYNENNSENKKEFVYNFIEQNE